MSERSRTGTQRGKSGWIIAGALAVMGAVVGALLWQSSQPRRLLVRSLPNGAQVILHALTTGTVHQLDRAPPLSRWLKTLGVPLQISSALRIERRHPCTAVWVELIPPPRSALLPSSPPGGMHVPDTITWLDEHGCPLNAPWEDVGRGGSPSWMFFMEVPNAASGPRKVQGFSRFSNEPLLFEIPVDATGPARPLASPPRARPHLPQIRRTRKILATLTKFELKELGKSPFGTLRAEAREIERPDHRWEPVWVKSSDARGVSDEPNNVFDRGIWEDGIHFPVLCRRQGPWTLTTTFLPDPRSKTPPDLRWPKLRVTVRPGSTFSDGKPIPLNTSGDRLNVRDNACVADPGHFRDRPQLETAVLMVQLAKTSAATRVALTRVNGVPVREWFRRAGLPLQLCVLDYPEGVSQELAIALPNPSRTRTLEVEFVGYQGAETVDFLVSP